MGKKGQAKSKKVQRGSFRAITQGVSQAAAPTEAPTFASTAPSDSASLETPTDRVTTLAFTSDEPGPAPEFESDAAVVAPQEWEENSVPPMGDLDAVFFDSFVHMPEFDDDEPEARSERADAFRSAVAQRRRAYFARYVTGAVGASVVLCVVAIAKAALVRTNRSDAWGQTTGLTQASLGAALDSPPSGVAPGMPSSAVSNGAAPASARLEAANGTDSDTSRGSGEGETASAGGIPPAADSAQAPAVAPKRAAAVAEAAPAADAANAKRQSQHALDRGQIDASIAAGERAVALDPTDGEAWLILGAAYQQKGQTAAARRCFRSCVQQGKSGPQSECAAMLR